MPEYEDLTLEDCLIQARRFLVRYPDGKHKRISAVALTEEEIVEIDHSLNPFPRAPRVKDDPQPYVRIGTQVYEKIDTQAESYRQEVEEWKNRRNAILIVRTITSPAITGKTLEDQLDKYRRIEPSIRTGFRLIVERLYGAEVLSEDGFQETTEEADEPVSSPALESE